MQFVRAWRRAAAVVAALLILWGGWSAAAAQDTEVHRFFGFLGDITIDGDPIGPGSTIVALVDGDVAGETTVNAAGAWILDIDAAVFDGGDCNITFVVNDLRAETAWDTCTMRVRLALLSPVEQAAPDSESDAASSASADQSEASSTESKVAEDDKEEEMEEEGDNGTLVQSEELVRPNTPRTGTGGILDKGGSANWARTAAVTAALTLAAALAALLISRRTDGQT